MDTIEATTGVAPMASGESMDEQGVEVEALSTINTTSTVEQETFEGEQEKTLEEEVSEIFQMESVEPPTAPPPRKFTRIRTHVQKLNEEFLATLYQSDERHKEEIKKLYDQIESHEEKNEVLQFRIKTLQANEQEHLVMVKRASEKIKRLEATEENHKHYVKMAGERISALEVKEREKARVATEKVRIMEAREEKVLALAKKAAIKIKDLESYKKKQISIAKTAVDNIQTLKQMLLDKHEEMQLVKQKALEEYDALAQELAKVHNQRTELQSSLVEARQQYKSERERRKGDQKKIYSLRKMIEQYDEGVESTWSDLSNALSEEEIVNPLSIYQENSFTSEEEFEQVKDKVLSKIPEEIKFNYRQVGFFNTNDFHFPVLALGPFDVPPGELREKWLEKATSSLGVYFYGQDDASMAYDMIPAESFVPYKQGTEKDFHVVPTDILSKTLEGKELSPIEQVFEEGIKRANAAAEALPDDRDHPLKDFSELDGQSQIVDDDQSEPDLEIKPEELATKFKETIGACSSDDTLEEELGKIKDTELLQVSSKKNRKKKLALSVDVDGDDGSCVSTPSIDSCGNLTVTSLEEQMHCFMQELATSKKNAINAARKAERMLETCHEESRDGEETPRESEETTSESPVEELAESRDDVDEARDDAPEEDKKPAPEVVKATAQNVVKEESAHNVVNPTAPTAAQVSLVKSRLKMFGGPQPKAGNKTTVVPDSSTKDLMKMWQKKAGNITPKQRNTTPKQNSTPPRQRVKAFNFGETKKAKPQASEMKVPPVAKADSVPQQSQPQQQQPGSTRCVTIPKNILKKIEAGCSLTDHERQILKGIQKFNHIKSSASMSSVDSADLVQQSSTVSGVTLEGCNTTEDKQHMEVSAE